MKKKENNNLIKRFLSTVNIKKLLLAVYIAVPIMIITVGFAAWTITGHTASGGSGSFVSHNIINSYDYIQFSDVSNNIDIYPTGFYQDGSIVNTAKIDTDLTIYLVKCKTLADKQTTENKKLYLTITMTFASGTASPLFNASGNNTFTTSITNKGVNALNITGAGGVYQNGSSACTVSATSSSFTAIFELDFSSFNPGSNSENTATNFTVSFTLTPDADAYNALFGGANKTNSLVMDIRITDSNPSA